MQWPMGLPVTYLHAKMQVLCTRKADIMQCKSTHQCVVAWLPAVCPPGDDGVPLAATAVGEGVGAILAGGVLTRTIMVVTMFTNVSA
jgi:hypothetical protein